MKETFYFSHDYNARQDPKIKKMIMKHNMIGYGIWWSIIEDLYNNANALQSDYDSIAFDLRVDVKVVQSVIEDFDLFVFKDGFFGSLSVQERIDKRTQKSEKARLSAIYRWNKNENNANALRTDSDSNANKVKESKIKENKIVSDISLFSEFWELYDRKIGRAGCERVWNRLSVHEHQEILAAVPAYVSSTPDIKFRKHPKTYLNGRHWEDEIMPVKQIKTVDPYLQASLEALKQTNP